MKRNKTEKERALPLTFIRCHVKRKINTGNIFNFHFNRDGEKWIKTERKVSSIFSSRHQTKKVHLKFQFPSQRWTKESRRKRGRMHVERNKNFPRGTKPGKVKKKKETRKYVDHNKKHRSDLHVRATTFRRRAWNAKNWFSLSSTGNERWNKNKDKNKSRKRRRRKGKNYRALYPQWTGRGYENVKIGAMDFDPINFQPLSCLEAGSR